MARVRGVNGSEAAGELTECLALAEGGCGVAAPEVGVVDKHTPELQGQRKDPGLQFFFCTGGGTEVLESLWLGSYATHAFDTGHVCEPNLFPYPMQMSCATKGSNRTEEPTRPCIHILHHRHTRNGFVCLPGSRPPCSLPRDATLGCMVPTLPQGTVENSKSPTLPLLLHPDAFQVSDKQRHARPAPQRAASRCTPGCQSVTHQGVPTATEKPTSCMEGTYTGHRGEKRH